MVLTLAITVALWSFLRALDDGERHPFGWAMLLWAAIAIGLLLKGLIAALFPVAAAILYLAITRQLFVARTWRRLQVVPGRLGLLLAIAAPWHVLATLRNPPYFDFTMHSERGSYRGFFWFYFINEHVLRFLNRRYPRDYNTVPRLWFWLFHLLWLFPWTVYLPAIFRQRFPHDARRSRVRLLARAGLASFWYFSPSRRRRNIIQCPVIRHWRCFWDRPWWPPMAVCCAQALVWQRPRHSCRLRRNPHHVF